MAYTPNEWGVGNLITASKMNKIERQLVVNTSDLDDIRNGVTVPTYDEFETLRDDVAAEYDNTKTYAVGDYVIYNTQLYKCKTAITSAETWTVAHWDAVEVGEELQRIEGKNEEEVAELKSAFLKSTFEQTSATIAEYKQGGINIYGAGNADANRCRGRADGIDIGALVRFEIKPGYEILARAYTRNALSSNYFAGTPFSWSATAVEFVPVTGYTYYIVVRKSDDSNITPESLPDDLLNITVYRNYTDTTLTKEGVPADAKTVGEICMPSKNQIVSYNSVNLIQLYSACEDKSTATISAEWNNDKTVCTINGQTSDSFFVPIITGPESLNAFVPGERYYFDVETTDNLYVTIYYQYIGTPDYDYDHSQVFKSSRYLTMPDNMERCMIRVYCARNTTYDNAKISIRVYNSATNKKLEDEILSFRNAPDDVEIKTGAMLKRLPTRGNVSRRALILDANDVDENELLGEYGTIANTTKHNLIFSWEDSTNTVTIVGTRDNTPDYLDLITSSQSLNAFLAGGSYRVEMSKNTDAQDTWIIAYFRVDGELDYNHPRYLANGVNFTIPVNYEGCVIRLYTAMAPRTYTNAQVSIRIYNEPTNFASENGPYLMYSDYVKCPKHIIVVGDENSTGLYLANFYTKVGDEYRLRRDVLCLSKSTAYNMQTYTFVNLINRANFRFRIIDVPDDTYISIARLQESEDVRFYGWDGLHVGPDLSGYVFAIDPSVTSKKSYNINQTGFHIPGDATIIWTKNAAIVSLWGVKSQDNFEPIFADMYYQGYALPTGYEYFVGNLVFDYTPEIDSYSIGSYQNLSGAFELNDVLSCDSVSTPCDVPVGISENIIKRANYLCSVRWTAVKRHRWFGFAEYYREGFTYAGIPYTSQFMTPAQVGWHISLHTFLNAVNDGDSKYYNEHGYTGYGPGYGLVCTTFNQLVSCWPYPVVTNMMEVDPRIQRFISYQPHLGAIGQHGGHCVLFGRSYAGRDYSELTVYEGVNPLTSVNTRMNRGNIFYEADTYTPFNYNKQWIYECYHKNATDTYHLYAIDNQTVVNGTARPYVGDRGVFTSDDDIVINIKGDATFLYLQKCTYTNREFTPIGDPVSINIPSGATSVTIDKANLEDGGFYGVYTDLGSVMEYFEYHVVEPASYTVTDGVLSFSRNYFWYATWSPTETPNGLTQMVPKISDGDYTEYKGLVSLYCSEPNKYGYTGWAHGVIFYKGTLGAYVAQLSHQD